MNLAVVGCRWFTDYEFLRKILDSWQWPIDSIISGAAIGVDSLAAEYAKIMHIYLDEFPVLKEDWEKYGKSAGPKRNIKIIQACDQCIALWDGISTGTKSSINLCKKFNKPVHIYWINK